MSKISYDRYGRNLTYVDENGTLYMRACEKDHEIQESLVLLLCVVDAKLDKLLETTK